MGPGVRYALARLGIFAACALPAIFLLPREMNALLKLMIALLVSAVLSYFLLRGMRDEVTQQMAESARRKADERQRLRSALAGEDDGEGDRT